MWQTLSTANINGIGETVTYSRVFIENFLVITYDIVFAFAAICMALIEECVIHSNIVQLATCI